MSLLTNKRPYSSRTDCARPILIIYTIYKQILFHIAVDDPLGLQVHPLFFSVRKEIKAPLILNYY